MALAHKFGHLNIPGGTIRLSVTNVCNMSCFYCHNEGQSQEHPKHLSFADFKKIISYSGKFGLRGVTFTGGEPFMNPEVVKMIIYCDRMGMEKIDICTNGILLNKYINKIRHVKKLKFTIGIDRLNLNSISKQSEAGKTFGEIESMLNILRKNRKNFSINTVYTKQNYKDIVQMINFCFARKIELRILEMDTFKHLTDKLVTNDFRKIIKKISRKYLLKMGYFHPGKGYFGKHKSGAKVYFYNAKCHSRDCLNCARCHFRVNAEGKVVVCYVSNLKIPILLNNKKEAENNLLKALTLQGFPPEKQEQYDYFIHRQSISI